MEFVPTGELRITIDHGYGRDGRPGEFRDTSRVALEERLPALLRELEIRAREDACRRQQEARQSELKGKLIEQPSPLQPSQIASLRFPHHEPILAHLRAYLSHHYAITPIATVTDNVQP